MFTFDPIKHRHKPKTKLKLISSKHIPIQLAPKLFVPFVNTCN